MMSVSLSSLTSFSPMGNSVGMTIDGIKKGHVGLGLTAAIERCGDILATEFPIGEDDVNELKDTLIIRE